MAATAGATTHAFYRCEVKPLSRSEGRHATAAAAYRTADEIHDERTGFTFDYRRRQGVAFTELVVPEEGAWIADRQTLWNAAEQSEKRGNARVARDVIASFPHQLTPDERERCSREMATWLCKRYRVAVDVAIHHPHRKGDERNWHAHLLITTRRVTANGLGEKTRELDDVRQGPAEVEKIREAWAETVNRALERQQLDVRADHRSNRKRGINRIPQPKLGRSVIALEQQGIVTDIGEQYRAVAAANENIADLERQQKRIAAEIAALEQELAAERQRTAPPATATAGNRVAAVPVRSKENPDHHKAIEAFQETWTDLQPIYPTASRRDWHTCHLMRKAGFDEAKIRAALHHHVAQRDQSKRSPQQLAGYVNRTVSKVMALPEAQRNERSSAGLTRQQQEESLSSFRAAWAALQPRCKTRMQTDWHTCRMMAEAGFSEAEIRHALQHGSPEARQRKHPQANAYINRTVTKVMELPSVQQSRAELARQAAERDQRQQIRQQMHQRQPEREHLPPVHAKGEKEQIALNAMLAYGFPPETRPQPQPPADREPER